MGSGDDSERIKVYVRLRPLSEKERQKDGQFPWRVEDNTLSQTSSKQKGSPRFNFDQIFGPEASNDVVYRDSANKIIQQVIAGFNGTIFAYGQTSSGKTYTMRGSKSQEGIIGRAVNHIFDLIDQTQNREFLLRVSYMEIYNEEINDLLVPEQTGLPVRESPESGVYVAGLREEIVDSPERILDLIEHGDRHKHVGSTQMNEKSSRSHTVFRMVIESRDIPSATDDPEQLPSAIYVSHLNLVDLAGSERVSKTGAEGQRLKEGSNINKSLLTLGKVIKALSEGAQAAGQHIPYRESKLTRILELSLGGNANTAIICNISPACSNIDESMCSLRFATQAKNVKNHAVVNEVLSDAALLVRQQKEIEELRRQLADSGAGDVDEQVAEMRRKLLNAEKAAELLKEQLDTEKTRRMQAEQEASWSKIQLEQERKEKQSQAPSSRKRQNRRETWWGSRNQANLLEGVLSPQAAKQDAKRPKRGTVVPMASLLPIEEDEAAPSLDDVETPLHSVPSPPVALTASEAGAEDGPAMPVGSEPGSFLPPAVLSPIPPTPCSPSLGVFQKMARRMQALREDVQEAAAVSQSPFDHADGALAAEAASREQELQARVQQLEAQLREKEAQLQQVCEADPHAQLALHLQMDLDASQQLRSALRSPTPAEPDAKRMRSPPEACSSPCTGTDVCESCVRLRAHLAEAQAEVFQLRNAPAVVLRLQVGDSAASMGCDGTRPASPSVPEGLAADPSTPPAGGSLHLSPPQLSHSTDVASLAHAVLDSAEQLRCELQQAVLQLADVCQQCSAPAEEEVDPDLEELADAIPALPMPSFDTPLLQTVQLAMGINRSAAARIRDRVDAIRSAVSAGSQQDGLPPPTTIARSPGGPAADSSGFTSPAVVRLQICVTGVEGGDGGGAPHSGVSSPAALPPSPAAVPGPSAESAPCAAVCSPAADLALAASRLPQSALPTAQQAACSEADAMLVDSSGGGSKQVDPDAAAQPQADHDGAEVPDLQSQLQAALLRVSQLEQQLAEAAEAARAEKLVESAGATVAGSHHLEEDIRAKVDEAVAELVLGHEQEVQRLQAELALAASSSGHAAAPAVSGSKSSAKAAAVDRRKSDIHAIGEIQKARAEVKQKDQLLKVKERELAGLTKEIEKQRKKVEGLETKHRLAVQEKQNAGSLQNKCAKLESQVARLQERIKGSEDVQAGLRLERDDKLLQLAHTQGLLDRAQAEQDSLRAELGSESEARTQAEAGLAAAAADLDAKAAALQALEQQLEQLQADMQAAQASREHAEAAAREEQSKLAAANAELTEEQQRLLTGSQELEAALQTARTRVKELEAAADTFHEQAELAAFQIRELTLHVDVLEGKKAEQEEQARQLQAAAEAQAKQHQELQAAHEQLRQQLQAAESRLAEASAEQSSLQEQLRSAQEQAEAERTEAGAAEGRLQSQLAQVQEQLQAAAAAAQLREQELAAQMEGMQNQRAAADAAAAEARQEAEQQRQQQHDEMLQALSAQERAAAAAEERGQQLERRLQDVEAAASQQAQAMQAEALHMQSELAGTQEEAAGLRRALEASAAESQRFQAAAATAQEEAASLQQERAGLAEQVQALQNRASQASEHNAAADEHARQQLQQAVEGRDVALRQLEQLQSQLQDAVAAQQATARELEAMQTEWHTAAAEKQQLEEQLHSVRQELQAASAQAQEMAGSCNELQCDLDSARAECELLREKAAAGPMEEDLAAAGRQLESARLQHDNLREQMEQLEGEQLNLMQQNDTLSKQMEVLQEQLLREATHAQALLRERDEARASAAGRQEAVEELQARLQLAEQRVAQLVEEARGKENSPAAAAGAPTAKRSQASSPVLQGTAALPQRGAEACAAPPRLDEAEIAQALGSIQERLQSTLMQALQEKGNAMHEDAREARKKQAKLNAKHIRYVNMLRSMFGEPAVGQFVHYRQQLEADWDRWRKHSGRAPGAGELAIRKLIGQAQDTAQALHPLGGACAKVAGLQQQLAVFSSDLEAKLLEPLLHVKRQNMRLYAVSQKLFEWADSTFGPEVSEKVQQQREEEIRQRGQLRSIGNQLPPAT